MSDHKGKIELRSGMPPLRCALIPFGRLIKSLWGSECPRIHLPQFELRFDMSPFGGHGEILQRSDQIG